MQHAISPLELFATFLTNPTVHMACLTIILVACALAVFSHIYDDTLTQRAAFLIVALGASAQLGASFRGYHDMPAASGAMLIGWAMYCAATIVKVWRQWSRNGKPSHPLRRSTDSMPLEPMTANSAPLSTAWQDTIREERRASKP